MSCHRVLLIGVISLAAVLAIGCNALSGLLGIFQPNQVTVELVNNSEFAVEGRLFYDDDQDTIEAVLEEEGTERTFVIPAGGRNVFSVRCDNLQSIFIEDADLQILEGIGPSASTDVQRDGDDFGCGDTLVFTFSHSDAILDFDVTVTTRSGG